jgi:aminoglycoside phosphotransferase family enzyme/predicted kinase
MQARLVASLANPAIYPGDVAHVDVIETHISYILLTGRYAYKIKKSVNLEFLDFTTLAARRLDCEDELRLNRPLAPSIYLGVVAITGTVGEPAIDGDGPVLEYAVKMRQFPQEVLLSHLISAGTLTLADIDALAAAVASFHGRADVAGPDTAFGTAAHVLETARQNFSQIRPRLDAGIDRTELEAIAEWTEREHASRIADFDKRRRDGFVRECHGDLHLDNIVRLDGQITPFDRLEFNPSMRWIDVMSDVAFLVMDLQYRGRTDMAFRVLNAYLEKTADYGGLSVLRFYLAYRAMVRAKVASFRAGQIGSSGGGQASDACMTEYREYVKLAARYSCRPRPALVLMHGLSGCGKTTLSQALVESVGAIRVRTDVERKRLHGLGPEADSHSSIDAGLYAPDGTQQTYLRVRELAHRVLAAGYIAVVDGAFLQRWQRDLFCDLANELGIPFVIIDLTVDAATLRERITKRLAGGHDASEAGLAVLDRQIATEQPIAPDEQRFAVQCDAGKAAVLPEIRRLRPDLGW